MKALLFLPEIIKNSIFIKESQSYKENGKYSRYRYFVCGVDLDGISYTVKSVFGLDDSGSWVYDQELSEIDKGTLIGMLTKHVTPDSLQLKDTTLLSVLQDNFSKVLDSNGEPLVVKHGSQALWDAFDMNEARQNSDIVGAFFSSADEEAETYGYGGYVRDFFLNIKNPAPYEYAYEIFRENQKKELAGAITRERLFSEGFDGVIYKEDGENDEYIVFNNTDLKSATDNNGDFSSENPNIFAQQKLTSEEQVAEKADGIDNTYTFSDFAEADVENMRSAPFYYYMFSKDAVMLCC